MLDRRPDGRNQGFAVTLCIGVEHFARELARSSGWRTAMHKLLAILALVVALALPSEAVAKKGHHGPGHSSPPSKVDICHRTGSETNPFVLIRVSSRAQAAHVRHGDVFPTDGVCPSA